MTAVFPSTQKPPIIDRRYSEDLESRGAGVERRVEIDQVHAGVGNILAQDFEIVAEVEFVFPVHADVEAALRRHFPAAG